jgi:hypothetical protein
VTFLTPPKIFPSIYAPKKRPVHHYDKGDFLSEITPEKTVTFDYLPNEFLELFHDFSAPFIFKKVAQNKKRLLTVIKPLLDA